MNNPQPDVVIVGGGIVGCLTAYYLGLRGLSSVVVEREGIGSQASGSAAGILTSYWGAVTPAILAFASESYRLHRELAEIIPQTTGIGYGYGFVPFLRAAFSQEDELALKAWHQDRVKEGNKVTWLSGDEARRISNGWLSPDARAAVLSELEPQVDPYRFVLAVATAAEAAGARIQSGDVTGILSDKGRATGVTLANGGTVRGGSVLLALGPWSKLTGGWTGLDLPIEPMRGQIVRFSIDGPLPDLALIHINGEHYLLRKPSGELISGTTWEWEGFDKRTTPEGLATIIEGALKLAPGMRDAAVVEHRACLRPFSQDDHPIIGRVPGWEGLYLATGHAAEGILLSAATGKFMAQLIAIGQSDYDLSPFSPERLLHQPKRPGGPASFTRHGT